MTKAESAMAHEKADVVMLRREGKSDVTSWNQTLASYTPTTR